MKTRLVFGFALLLCVALIRPGSVFGSDAEEALSQATPIAPNVLAVVRNQGTSLHDRPNGEPFSDAGGRYAGYGAPALAGPSLGACQDEG